MGFRFQPESETLQKSDRSKYSRRVVAKTPLVQDAEFSGSQIPLTAEWIMQQAELSGVQLNGHRIDGEIPTIQICLQCSRLHVRQCCGFCIGLRSCTRDVHLEAVGARQSSCGEPFE